MALMAALEDMDAWLDEGETLANVDCVMWSILLGAETPTFCSWREEPDHMPLLPKLACTALLKVVWCNADSAQVAIFDATNSTEQRRQLLVSSHQQMKQDSDIGS